MIFYTNNGCITNRWFPSVENGPIDAAALTGKTLAPLGDLAHKLLFPRGLAMFPRGTINGYFDPHDQGMGSKLTGAPIDPRGQPLGDRAFARPHGRGAGQPGSSAESRSPPLVLSVGNAFANVKGIVSYKAAQTPFTPETNPKNVYSKLTGLFTTGGTTAADYLVTQGNSIIDCVRGDLQTLSEHEHERGRQAVAERLAGAAARHREGRSSARRATPTTRRRSASTRRP